MEYLLGEFMLGAQSALRVYLLQSGCWMEMVIRHLITRLGNEFSSMNSYQYPKSFLRNQNKYKREETNIQDSNMLFDS